MQIKFTYLNKRQMKSCLDIRRNSKASIYSKRKTVNKCKVPTSEEVNTFYAHNNSSQIRLFGFYLHNVNIWKNFRIIKYENRSIHEIPSTLLNRHRTKLHVYSPSSANN